MKKRHNFTMTAGNYTDAAASKGKFGKGVPNKDHPVRKTEITDAEFNRELEEMRTGKVVTRKKERRKKNA